MQQKNNNDKFIVQQSEKMFQIGNEEILMKKKM